VPAVPIGQMVPGTIYQVSYTGSDGRALTCIARHVVTPNATVIRLDIKGGTMTIDQAATATVATTAAAVLGEPH
jgi:hypothetical protein